MSKGWRGLGEGWARAGFHCTGLQQGCSLWAMRGARGRRKCAAARARRRASRRARRTQAAAAVSRRPRAVAPPPARCVATAAAHTWDMDMDMAHGVAASSTWGCSFQCVALQAPVLGGAAASNARGWLPPLAHGLAAASTCARCRSSVRASASGPWACSSSSAESSAPTHGRMLSSKWLPALLCVVAGALAWGCRQGPIASMWLHALCQHYASCVPAACQARARFVPAVCQVHVVAGLRAARLARRA